MIRRSRDGLTAVAGPRGFFLSIALLEETSKMPKPLVIRHYAPYLGRTPKCRHTLKVFQVLTSSEERVTCRACLRRLKGTHNGNHPNPKPALH